MKILYKADEPIISTTKTMREIGCSLNELIIALYEIKSSVIVVTSTPFHIGVRFPKKYRKGVFDRAGENPLSIDIEDADGFTLSPEDSKKVLQNSNWKTVTPQKVVWFTDNNLKVKIRTPYTLSLQYHQHAGKCPTHCVCGIDDLRNAYKNQEFFFIDKLKLSTQADTNNCYILQSDFDLLVEKFYEIPEPDFDELGGYIVNDWSTRLIKDINAIHNHLIKNKMIGGNKVNEKVQNIVKIWLEERYNGSAKIENHCYTVIPKVVSQKFNPEINFELILDEEVKSETSKNGNNKQISPLKIALYEKNKRNRHESTDLFVLIDILAQKNFEELSKKIEKQRLKKNEDNKKTEKNEDNKKTEKNEKTSEDIEYVDKYITAEKIKETLKNSGIKDKAIRDTIYSIIKHTASDIKKINQNNRP